MNILEKNVVVECLFGNVFVSNCDLQSNFGKLKHTGMSMSIKSYETAFNGIEIVALFYRTKWVY